MTKKTQRWRGRIGYYDGAGRLNGHEFFTINRYGDGRLSLGATCEIDDDGLTRDIVLNLDGNDAPIDAYVHTVEGGTLQGSARYHFDGDTCHGALLSPGQTAPTHQSMSTKVPFFGTHSLINDAWLARCIQDERDTVQLDAMLTCSLQANGGGVPGVIATSATLTRLSAASIETPAGRFDTRHFQVAYGDYPPIDMWVGEHEYVLVKMVWEPANVSYQLLSLDHREI